MAVLTEYLGQVNDTFNFGTTAIVAMSFKIPENSTITGWGIVGSRGISSTAGDFRVQIFEGGANPNAGTEKANQVYNRNVLPVYTTSPTLQSFTFTTDTGVLTGGSTTYYLVLTPLSGSTNDSLRWSADNSSGGNPTYADGNTWAFFSGSWTSYATSPMLDQNFQITGSVGGGGVVKPNFLGFAGI